MPELIEAIEHGPTGDLIFIVGANGQPLVKESFGNMFRVACNKAGVTKSAHGLRKCAAERYSELGLIDSEIETLLGWTPGSSARRDFMDSSIKRKAKRKQKLNA